MPACESPSPVRGSEMRTSACRLSHRTRWGVGTCMGNDTVARPRKTARKTPRRTDGLATLVATAATRSAGGARVRWTDGARTSPAPDPPVAEPGGHERLLLRGACLGDHESLEALCRQEWYGVYRLVSATVPDPTEAEELTQEVFARAIARLSDVPYAKVSFGVYLAQIARGLLRDRWQDGQTEDDDVADGADEEPETVVLSPEEWRRLMAALGKLPDRSREVLHLRLLEGRTAAEIGAEWGRTPQDVHRAHRRALRALQSEMEGRAVR